MASRVHVGAQVSVWAEPKHCGEEAMSARGGDWRKARLRVRHQHGHVLAVWYLLGSPSPGFGFCTC